MTAREHIVEIRHAHLFCGLGGGARGFNRAAARHGRMSAKFRCLGGVDHSPIALADFEMLAGVKGTLLDLFSREQFVAFHGHEPPAGWCEATPADLHRAFGFERPHIGFLSAPCKGFSGLLPEATSKTGKYQALNGLTLRGVWLFLEAYKDDPVELILFENVPRIASRGRHLLDQIVALLRAYGYATAETVHDCGELGGLAQSRKRFLLVARHEAKVPAFVYEPPKRPLRGVGEVLERLPLPGADSFGMHRMPALQWRTWVRLAFVEAGSDWRSLNKLAVENGVLRDWGIAPDGGFNGMLGVTAWEKNLGVVASTSLPTNGNFAVADPRVDGHAKSVQLGVRKWKQSFPIVTSKMVAGGGPNSVADPRILDREPFNHAYRIVEWVKSGLPVSSARGALAAVADPRPSERTDYKQTKYRVTRMDESSGAVIAASTTGNGAFAVADPRHGMVKGGARTAFDNGGHYGVVPWAGYANAVSASAMHDNGKWSVADPRWARGRESAAENADRVQRIPDDSGDAALLADASAFAKATADKSHRSCSAFSAPPRDQLPSPDQRLVCMIRARDGTWHRPLTTLELAALQSLFDPDDWREFRLTGKSDSAWREGIGNAVPSDSAEVIGSVMGRTLLAVWSGQTFLLSSEPIWVRPLAIALSVQSGFAEATPDKPGGYI